MNYIDKLNKLVVKIVSKNDIQGSGILFLPNPQSKLAYIITAKHCIYGDEFDNGATIQDVVIHYLRQDNEKWGIYSLQAGDKIESKKQDIAVLVIEAARISAIIGEIPCIKIKNLSIEDRSCSFKGYPLATDNNIAQTISQLDIIHEDSTDYLFYINTQQKLSTLLQDTKELVKGFSGSGVYINYEDNIYLLGIIAESRGWNNRFQCVKIHCIDDLIDEKLHFYKLPSQYLMKPFGSSSDYVNISGNYIYNNAEQAFIEAGNLLNNYEILYTKSLEQVEKDYKNYNPQRALSHIEEIIKPIEAKSNYDPKLMARLKYLRGCCKYESGIHQEWESDFLHAYTYEPKNRNYQEKAIFVFFSQKVFTKAAKIATELETEDPCNVVAWAVKYALNEDVEIPEWLLIGEEGLRFKSIAGNFLRANNKNEKFLALFSSDLTQCKEPKITFENKGYWLILADLRLSAIIRQERVVFFHHVNPQIQNHPDLRDAVVFLTTILKFFDGTEKRKNFAAYDHLLAYSNYLLNPNKANVLKMMMTFKQVEDANQANFAYSTACALVQTEQFDKAIDFIKKLKTKDINFAYLKAYIYVQQNRFDEAEKCAKKYFDSIEIFTIEILLKQFIYFQQVILQNPSKKEKYYQTYLKQSKFNCDFTKKFTFLFSCFENQPITDVINLANEICDMEDTKNYKEVRFITSSVLSEVQQFELANTIIEQYIDFENCTDGYDMYIHNLYYSQSDAVRLLYLLENRREKNQPFNPIFIRMELVLLKLVPDYAQILEIMEIGLVNLPDDADFIMHKIQALFELDKNEEMKVYLSSKRDVFNTFNLNQIKYLCPFAIEAGECKAIKEMLYVLASDKDNILARDAYFHFYIIISDISERYHAKPLHKITSNCFVEIEYNGQKKLFSVNSETAKKNTFVKFIFDNKCFENHIFQFNSTSYKVVKIYDVYDGLFQQINRDIHGDIDPSYTVKSISFGEAEPSFDKINELFVKMFGKEGDERHKEEAIAIDEYKKGHISFLELSGYDNPLVTYYKLTQQNYLRIFPLPVFTNWAIPKDITFILDFTTVPLFFRLSKQLNLAFNKKFLVSHALLTCYQRILEETRRQPHDSLRLNITTQGVEPHFVTPEFIENNLTHITELIYWIEKNCEVRLVREKLTTLVRVLDRGKAEINNNLQYLTDIFFLTNQVNHILISDDIFFARDPMSLLRNRNLISSEKYLTHNFPNIHESQILEQLLKFNYVGLTLSIPRVSEQLRKYLNGEDNYYEKCLPNLVATNSMKPEIAVESLSLVRIIYTYGASWELKKQETQRLFKVTLEGITDILPIEQIGLILVLIELELILFSIEWIESVQEDFIIALQEALNNTENSSN